MRGPGGAVVNYLMGAQLDGPMVILTLAAGGALDRFPELKIVTVETGASWLAWIMTQADAIYEDHSMYASPKLSLKPSELIRRQCAATFMYDPVAINNRGTTGVETLMWGNDYPHPEGTWPESQTVNADQFDGVEPRRPRRHRERQRGQGVRLRPRPARRARPGPSRVVHGRERPRRDRDHVALDSPGSTWRGAAAPRSRSPTTTSLTDAVVGRRSCRLPARASRSPAR